MLSENPNRLHLPVTHHPPIWLLLPKNITNLLGIVLLLGTHAEKGLLIYVLWESPSYYMRWGKRVYVDKISCNMNLRAQTFTIRLTCSPTILCPSLYPSDARNDHRESSPTLRKLNCSAFLLIESRQLVNKENRGLCLWWFYIIWWYMDDTNIETYLNSSLSAIVETFNSIELVAKFKCYGLDLLKLCGR